MHQFPHQVVVALPEAMDGADFRRLLPGRAVDPAALVERHDDLIAMPRAAVGKFPAARQLEPHAFEHRLPPLSRPPRPSHLPPPPPRPRLPPTGRPARP